MKRKRKRVLKTPKHAIKVRLKQPGLNFLDICTAINREPQHILDFLKAELDVEGNFGSENNLNLVGKYQNKHITNLYK